MNALSLFSGIGGIDLAAEAAGIRTVAMCERDPYCRAVLRKHWPEMPIFEDIKTLRGDCIGTPIDVVHGGPPCQPVSVAGRRRGKDDGRYLWGEVFRIVADVMPRFCVFENVLGILGIAGDEICSSLERLGYSVGICCFEAAAVGAPHRRMRVFFVAHSGCRMRERGAVVGEVRGEPEGRPPVDAERPNSAFMADAGRAESQGRVENAQGGERPPRREPAPCRGDVPDSDGERREEQRGAEPENGERAALGRAERGGGREPESRLGGMVARPAYWLDGYWDAEPDIPRTAKGIPNRVSRLRALGNCVVPAQVYPIFRAIAEEAEKE